MDLIFSGNDLYNVFNLVAGIVPSSTVRNILRGIRVDVKDRHVRLTATDLEVLVKCFVPVRECTGDGSIVLPAVRVNNILREWAGNDEVVISVEGGNCVLRSRGGYFRISGEDAAMFPDVTATDIKDFVEVDGAIIGDMVGKVVHSVSKIKARSVLSGVFVRVFGEDIVMVAMDGNRMSYVKRKVQNPGGVSMSGVVALKSMMFIQRFVSECRGLLRIGIGESRMCLAGENGEVISQLIDGQYPRYEDMIPDGNNVVVEVDKNELLTGVRMASYMTAEGCQVVKFILNKGKLRVTSRTADVGEAELEITVNYEGPDFEISFNPEYVADALKVSDDTVIMKFGGSDGAAVFKTGYEQVDVVMPIEMR